MKKQVYFSGVIFIGFGIYFLLQQYDVQLTENLYTWPTLLCIIGLAYLLQGYGGKHYDSILPGVVLTGLGIHFHISDYLAFWPDHTGVFLLLISLGFLLIYVKTGSGLFTGFLFLASAILLLFFDRLESWALEKGHNMSLFNHIWPFTFIAIGIYYLFILRNRK
ncbi:LiaF transmembrane domain-containing protein [Pseudogracilibacillus auburnensis]|uniref:LiaF transmembrane domain-containing protein n=1 Tax=Pseudogracilibacillus auburnensis TaxID=1494959 RepID=UPI001A97B0D2|nr:DUF5668 domain-containing protein [Pseudogracilibacillus auburnensis]MBO1005579.1 hypothetical protein [Pseudogracilibacillus auburnensis]